MRLEDVRPGMKVLVTRRLKRHDDWRVEWTPSMDKYVGSTYIVDEVIPNNTGVTLVSYDEFQHNFPWQVLEPVDDEFDCETLRGAVATVILYSEHIPEYEEEDAEQITDIILNYLVREGLLNNELLRKENENE